MVSTSPDTPAKAISLIVSRPSRMWTASDSSHLYSLRGSGPGSTFLPGQVTNCCLPQMCPCSVVWIAPATRTASSPRIFPRVSTMLKSEPRARETGFWSPAAPLVHNATTFSEVFSRRCPDLCRLEAVFRLADGFDGSVFNLFGVDRRLRRVVAIDAQRRRSAVVVHRSQDQVFGGDAGLLRDPLRHGFPDRVGHADQFPGDDGRGPGAIAQHDGPRVDVIVNALETLFAAGIAAHWQGRAGCRRDVDFCGARLQRPAFGRLRRLKFRAKEDQRCRKRQGHIQQERSPDRACAR